MTRVPRCQQVRSRERGGKRGARAPLLTSGPGMGSWLTLRDTCRIVSVKCPPMPVASFNLKR